MKWKDISGKTDFGQQDTKARRVLNTSKKPAGICAEDIERGVSLEIMKALPVPVYFYGTQITIHGDVPGVVLERVGGYKAIIRNANGSIGVRYTAIDAEKKRIVARTCRVSKCKMSYTQSSTGSELHKGFHGEKAQADALALKASIPDVFIGSAYFARDPYGRLYVVSTFAAIPEENLWAFIAWLSDGTVQDAATLDALETEAKRKSDADYEARMREYAIERAQREEKEAAMLAPLRKAIIAASLAHYAGVSYSGLVLVAPFVNYHSERLFRYKIYKKHGRGMKISTVCTKALVPRSALDGVKTKGYIGTAGTVKGWIAA